MDSRKGIFNPWRQIFNMNLHFNHCFDFESKPKEAVARPLLPYSKKTLKYLHGDYFAHQVVRFKALSIGFSSAFEK